MSRSIEDSGVYKKIVATPSLSMGVPLAVMISVITLSGGAIYKAAATEKQVEQNTKQLEHLSDMENRVTRIEVNVEHIVDEQEEIKGNVEDIKETTQSILLELRAIQRNATEIRASEL